jgi:hypothetical protein
VAFATLDPRDGLTALRRARRQRRIEQIHWVDALYQAYLSALIAVIVEFVAISFVRDEQLDVTGVARVLADGPALLGVVVAAALFVGLQSGSKGGPVALEAAEVRHVLLAPISRREVLRGPALRQLRFGLFVGAVAGAIGGQLAARRLPESAVIWILSGAAFGAATVALAYGAALVVCGRRPPRWIVSLVGLALVAWSVADAAGTFVASPTALLGRLAVWPLDFDPLALVPVAIGALLLVGGLRWLGGISVESAERRTSLVGQLRFAATLQDIRTVIVLRRQLAQELPRLRPWVRVGRRPGRLPAWKRGWQGFFRWPAARVARLSVAAVVAGLALRGVWDGTTVLIVVAGLALFVVGLDAAEPLAQELDHPGRRDSFPLDTGTLYLRHLPATLVVCMLAGIAGGVAGVLAGPSVGALGVTAISAVAAALGAASGAVISIVMGAPAQSDTALFLPPEVTGMRIAARTAWPPIVSILGCLPVLAARAVANSGSPAFKGAIAGALPIVVVAAFVVAWVRFRDQAKAWWKAQLATAFPSPGTPARG